MGRHETVWGGPGGRKLTDAQRDLAAENAKLAHWAVGRYRRHPLARRLDPDDLHGAACLGLLKAAWHFDPSRGRKFSTVARHWMDQEMRTEALAMAGAVCVPQSALAPGAGGVEAARAVLSSAPASAGALLPLPARPDPDPGPADEAAALLALLPEREAEALRLTAGEGLTGAEAGARMGVTGSRAQQLAAAGRARLRGWVAPAAPPPESGRAAYRRMAAAGLTVPQMAREARVSEASVRRWRRQCEAAAKGGAG